MDSASQEVPQFIVAEFFDRTASSVENLRFFALGKSLQEPWAEISLAFASEPHPAGCIKASSYLTQPKSKKIRPTRCTSSSRGL
jgi:hypothetical protein